MEDHEAPRVIRVLLVDDHAIVREGLRALFEGTPIEVVGEAGTGADAVRAVAERSPEAVLMDIRMPDMDGLAATRLIKQSHPRTAVIVLTSFEDREHLREAILSGAAGYLLKGASQEQLVNGIRLVVEGSSLFDGTLLRDLVSEARVARALSPAQGRAALEALSERERTALRCVAQGMTNREIADELGYSVGTIKNIVQEVIAKLGVSDRTQAAVAAVQAGLIDP